MMSVNMNSLWDVLMLSEVESDKFWQMSLLKYVHNVIGMPKGDMRLLNAVKGNDVNLVRTLLDRGHDADARGHLTWSCLQEAVMKNHYEIVDLLSARSKCIDKYSYGNTMGDYYTALHFAIMHRNKDIVELLLSRGADVSLPSLDLGRTVLHIAAQYSNPEIIELLLKSGADVNAVDNSGQTVLDFCVLNENLEVLKFLIACGCDVDHVDVYGETLLMSCLRNCCNAHAKHLLKENIGTRIKRNYRGDTLLHIAVACNSDEIIRMILDLGVDLDAVNKHGFTAFYVACKDFHYYSIQSLLKYNCDTTVVDKSIIKRLPNHNLITFKKQAIRLGALNRADGLRNFLHVQSVSEFGFDRQNYCIACVNEMRKMKVLRIGDTNVTLYSIVEKDINRIAKFMNNDVIRQFSLTNLHCVLPILPVYRDTISYLFMVGRIRSSLIQKCKQLCIANSSLGMLPLDCVENILYRLSNIDLFVLVDSFDSSIKV